MMKSLRQKTRKPSAVRQVDGERNANSIQTTIQDEQL